MNAIISPDAERVKIRLVGVCRTCGHYHRMHEVTPNGFSAEVQQWADKHDGHDFEYVTDRRRIPAGFDDRVYEQAGEAPWWLQLKANADFKIAYASSAAITITLASLSSGSAQVWTSGRESALQDNTTNKYVSGTITARVTTGTTPTADRQIRIYAYRVLNDTPVYPNGLAGSDAAATITSANHLELIPLLGTAFVTATSNSSYDFPNLPTLEQTFGIHPWKWGVYIAHDTAVALNSTAGNHIITYRGAYFTVV